MKTKIGLLIVTLALLCVVGWNSKAHNSWAGDAWEYKVVTEYRYSESQLANIKQLNELGDQGWELVQVTSDAVAHGSQLQTKVAYYFKRSTRDR